MGDKKRGIRFLFVLAFGGVLLSGAVNERIPTAQNDKNKIESGTKTEYTLETESIVKETEEKVAEYGSSVSFSEYDCFNEYNLTEEENLWCTNRKLREAGMYLHSEELNGDFTPVAPEDCSFPEELVVIMEDIFYHSANSYQRDKEDSYAKVKFRELGSEKFKVQSEEERNRMIQLWTDDKLLLERYTDVYHFHLTEETDDYLFVSYLDTPFARVGDVYLMEQAGDGLVKRNYFEIESLAQELIQYGGEFYLISWEENDFLGITEGIRIHRLNGNPEEETLCIRYLPEEYVWLDTDVFDPYQKDIPEYVEELKKEFVHGRYLTRDEEDFEPAEIYNGDEKDWESVELHAVMSYKVDIANCGLPVYVMKEHTTETESGRFFADVKTKFFYYNSEKNDFTELEKMACRPNQLWFKEIRGKIYTCWMEHICDFNYIFRMEFLKKKGEKVDSYMVYSAAVVPRRKFVVTEGPVNVNRR